jgi:hypothetical protein
LGRKGDDESHSLSRVVVHFDLAPMGGDNFVDDGQTQTQAAIFRRIEGVEDIVKIFRVDSLSRILHLNPDTGGSIL